MHDFNHAKSGSYLCVKKHIKGVGSGKVSPQEGWRSEDNPYLKHQKVVEDILVEFQHRVKNGSALVSSGNPDRIDEFNQGVENVPSTNKGKELKAACYMLLFELVHEGYYPIPLFKSHHCTEIDIKEAAKSLKPSNSPDSSHLNGWVNYIGNDSVKDNGKNASTGSSEITVPDQNACAILKDTINTIREKSGLPTMENLQSPYVFENWEWRPASD
ncbi:hypothetical protein [Endozoicomonas sp.]|uniref:hypothetical protein n=1 Tax=Endozoicomonas sp. TaxID=1892382 RepID=UPI00383BDB9A